ncbi:hypothetical protein [Homoserinibacter sp. GY 40078]|uniref:hypothetical protein n=1 Tax=Homoserinibacter sp. GY 40078 TaxID=2603275 RepID=UPI0011CB0141|nr:hypothetical protein [Homoserinibacter sp. GY 40078]TXK17693.1 hypothetical protein FVQ89_12885 [Homoserinibacter sp. GY 40078]
MSAATARLLPASAPTQEPRRHLDVAPSRAQKRARPRLYAALVAIGGIGVILLAQLGMSMVLADGAYQISHLQTERRDLQRDQNASQESLERLSSTQNLIAGADALGMVVGGNPVFLDVSKAKAVGSGGPATGQIVGQGGNLIGNVLADGSDVIDLKDIEAAQNAAITTDAGDAESSGSGVVPSTSGQGAIPSPTTR